MGSLLLKILIFVLALISVIQARSRTKCRTWFNNSRVKCPLSGHCILKSGICNGIHDCNINEDEAFCGEQSTVNCPVDNFQCSNGECLTAQSQFCDGNNDCSDGSDEFFCDIGREGFCPPRWFKCSDNKRCIPEKWKCNRMVDCLDGSYDKDCDISYEKATITPSVPPPQFPNTFLAKRRNIEWLMSRRKNDSSTNRWGPDLHRIATALYLADEQQFKSGSKVGEEITYELTIRLLDQLSGNNTMRSQELALYIHALIVTCANPRDFFGHNLVSELRSRVDSSNYTNPLEIIALCNAGDIMTNKDIERVTTAFDSQHRPFWTDTQAIAAMAMQCLASFQNVRVDERIVKDMQDELKKRQFRNGTVDTPITTALVVQALLRNESYKEYFDLSAAITVLLENQDSSGSWGSIRNSYYILPAINFKSLLNISSSHCVKTQESEEEALKKLQEARGEKFVVQYSVWIGNDVDLGRTWRVMMKTSNNNSFYDVIETVRKLDTRHNVTYNVIDNKPYVSALFGKEDDPELGLYWFTYVRSLLLPEAPKLVKASPVDVKVGLNQELILWYKPGRWSGGPLQEET